MGRRDQREKKDLEVEKENKPVEKEEPSDRSVDEDEEPQPSQPPKKKAKPSKKVSEAEDEASPVTDEETDAGETKKEKKDDADKKRKIKKQKRRRVDANHPPTVDMVLEALMALDEKKGTSIKAMKDYILAQNTVRPEQLSHLMRKALVKLLGKELIIRPKGEENKSVLLGRYKIAPRKKDEKQAPRERPATLRKLRGGNDTPKKKKKRRKGFY